MHHCKYLIVHCIDFRIQKEIKKYMQQEEILGDCDVVSCAGAVKNKDFIIEQIGISVRLHNTKEVILVNHTDCGAYGGSQNFNSPQEEKDFHTNEMRVAKEAILAKYPDLLVKILLVKILPDGQIESENIS